jgi:Protein kinase domain
MPAAGSWLGNHRLLFCVAGGDRASVWVARRRGPRGFSKLVALKLIMPELANQAGFDELLSEEARLAALVRHPNVCEVFELIEEGGRLALSMEWVDGDTLAGLLASAGPLEPRIAARVVASVAAGLHAAHELRDDAGVQLTLVHGDVSPQNILISRDGHVKLSDFGLAHASMPSVMAPARASGKRAFMSPEQSDGRALDRRSDVFSLGVVLYLATVGRLPFAGTHGGEMPFVPPRQVMPGFPRVLARIIERALKANPSERYQTAAAFRLDLDQWLAVSGPLLTESDIARVLTARRGLALDRREASIRCFASPRPYELLPAESSTNTGTGAGAWVTSADDDPSPRALGGSYPAESFGRRLVRLARRARGLVGSVWLLAPLLVLATFVRPAPEPEGSFPLARSWFAAPVAEAPPSLSVPPQEAVSAEVPQLPGPSFDGASSSTPPAAGSPRKAEQPRRSKSAQTRPKTPVRAWGPLERHL